MKPRQFGLSLLYFENRHDDAAIAGATLATTKPQLAIIIKSCSCI
jgi:hypothetical protein